MSTITNKIDELVDIGWHIENEIDFGRWKSRVFAFLTSATDDSIAEKFKQMGEASIFESWEYCRERVLGHLEGVALQIAATQQSSVSSAQTLTTNKPTHPSKKIFVVHGHDVEAKESVARFIERLRLEPIILHEQPNSGRTVIEKFEVFSDVGFAIVLLTPDDVGAPSTNQHELRPRARQNVILELGYFMGRLSRFRVCALYKHGVEIPSDYQGVLYIELDAKGAWRTKLAQELVEANYSIDLDGLLRS